MKFFIRCLFVNCLVLGLAILQNIAHAAAKQTLTIYTYDAFQSKWGPGPHLKNQFEKSCNCEVKFIAAADGAALISRLKLEGKRTKADVVVGLDSTMTGEAMANGLFASHDVKFAATLPSSLSIDDSEQFIPIDYGWYAFMYDTKAFASDAKPKLILPANFSTLLSEPSLKGKLIIQDPRSSSVGLGLLLWIHAVYGDKATEKLNELHIQTMAVGHGWSDSYSKFTKGEAPMVFSYSTSEAYHREEEKTDRYRALKFLEGHYLQVEVAGLIKHDTPNTLAKQFLQFLMTPDAQKTIARGNWMYPIIPDIGLTAKSYEMLMKPSKSHYLPASIVAKNRKKWTDEWVQIFGSK